MRRISTIAVIPTLCLLIVAACGGDGTNETTSNATSQTTQRPSQVVTAPPFTNPPTTDAPARQNLDIVKSGLTQLPANVIGNPEITYAAIVRNPNSAWIAGRVNVNLTFYTADGTVAKSQSENIAAMYPNQTVAVGGYENGAGAARVDVQALVSDWEPLTQTTGTFATEGVTTTRTMRYGSADTKTTGSVSSTFARDLKNTKAVAVYYNSAGAITGGGSTYIDFIPAGGKVGVEIQPLSSPPNIAKTELYVQFTSLTLSGG
jgi:hypothetical protein